MEKILNENQDVTIGSSLRHLAFKVAMKYSDLFYSCRFLGEDSSCCETFLPLYTEQGFCYAFNPRYIGSEADE